MAQQFVERRKQFRLPYEEKIIFTDGARTYTGYAANISRGGIFVTSLSPYPIETKGYLAFFIPGMETSLCLKARVVHVVIDRKRCEIENGMGFIFTDLTEAQQDLLNNHLAKEQETYLELKHILADATPNSDEISRCLVRLPYLRRHDLLALRYRVNRICTLFEGPEAGQVTEEGVQVA